MATQFNRAYDEFLHHTQSSKIPLLEEIEQKSDYAKVSTPKDSSMFVNIKYKPNRIFSLDPRFEISLKQFWSHFLIFWGYELKLDNEDIKYAESFVVSSSVQNRPVAPLYAEAANKLTITHLGPNFSRVPKTNRISQVEQNSNYKYSPIDIPDQYKYTYIKKYNSINELSKNYEDKVDQSTQVRLGKIAAKLKSVKNYQVTANPKIHPELEKCDPQNLHSSYFFTQRNDLLDNMFLRILRAVSLDYEGAFKYFVDDSVWRSKTVEQNKRNLRGDAKIFLSGEPKGINNHLRLKKFWICGKDLEDNVCCFFRVKNHLPKDSTHDETEEWLLMIIEWVRLLIRETSTCSDEVTIVFDMTGFGLKNIDYHALKFLIDTFQSHYPECLARVLIYNAPWIFSACYKIIKSWLDPVIAAKILFVKNSQLFDYVAKDQLPTFIGGIQNYEGEYAEPSVDDLYPPKVKDDFYWKLVEERHFLNLIFFERTKKWIETTDPVTSAKYLKDKINVGIQLSQNYCEMDPYIRRRGPNDRQGRMVNI